MKEMNNPPTNEMNDLITRALRGQLSESETRAFERRLETDQALREAYTLEQALDQALEHLPNIPVSTNFTSLVLQSVQSDGPARSLPEKIGWSRWSRLRFRFSSLATGLAVVTLVGIFSIRQEQKSDQQEMVRSVTSFTEVASALNSDEVPNHVFQDFEAIQRLSVPADSEVDLELLVALQK